MTRVIQMIVSWKYIVDPVAGLLLSRMY